MKLSPCAMLVLGFFAALGPADDAIAQEVAPPDPYADVAPPPVPQAGRTLHGHRFLAFRTVVFPFVVGRIVSDATVGLADVELVVEDIPRPGDLFSDDGKLAFLDETFNAQASLGGVLALRAGISAGVTGGADRIGGIDVGANAGLGLDAGVTVQLFRGDRAVISLAVDGHVVRALGVSPKLVLSAVEIVDGQITVSDVDVTYDARVLRLDPALAMAFALARSVGLQLEGGYTVRHVESSTGFPDGTEHSVAGGAGLSFFFGPAAILVGGRIVHDFDDDFEDTILSAIEPLDPTRGEGELGLYYTGRPNLDVGAIALGTLADENRRIQGTLRLAYYF